MHAVLVPTLEDAESAVRLAAFLKKPPCRFEVQLATFANDRWEAATDSTTIDWPEAAFS